MNINVSFNAYTTKMLTGRHSKHPKTLCYFIYMKFCFGSRYVAFSGQNIDWNYKFQYRNERKELSEA